MFISPLQIEINREKSCHDYKKDASWEETQTMIALCLILNNSMMIVQVEVWKIFESCRYVTYSQMDESPTSSTNPMLYVIFTSTLTGSPIKLSKVCNVVGGPLSVSTRKTNVSKVKRLDGLFEDQNFKFLIFLFPLIFILPNSHMFLF